MPISKNLHCHYAIEILIIAYDWSNFFTFLNVTNFDAPTSLNLFNQLHQFTLPVPILLIPYISVYIRNLLIQTGAYNNRCLNLLYLHLCDKLLTCIPLRHDSIHVELQPVSLHCLPNVILSYMFLSITLYYNDIDMLI